MMRSWNCSRFFWTCVKKCNSNHLEKKENGMVFVAGIAHRPKGTAEGTWTSDPRRDLRTTALTFSFYPTLISAGLWLALFCTLARSNDGEDACWQPQSWLPNLATSVERELLFAKSSSMEGLWSSLCLVLKGSPQTPSLDREMGNYGLITPRPMFFLNFSLTCW